jgi:NAD(P)-dependent dehydrogenase (short-subunit alcohol dehydrogenase family)
MDSRKNIVLTGGNTGIGLETAKALFRDGHNIIFGNRN